METVLACLLPNHFARFFVFPNSKKDRMPKTVIPRPFCEFDLADHHRFHPTATLHFGGAKPLVPTIATGGIADLVHAFREYRRLAESAPLTLQGSDHAHAVHEMNKVIDRAAARRRKRSESVGLLPTHSFPAGEYNR